MGLLKKAVDVGFVEVMFKPLDNAKLLRHFEKIENPDLVDETTVETTDKPPSPEQFKTAAAQPTQLPNDLAERLTQLETRLTKLTDRSKVVQQRQALRAETVAAN